MLLLINAKVYKMEDYKYGFGVAIIYIVAVVALRLFSI